MQLMITQNELINFTILNRRRNELRFKRSFLLRNGSTPEDMHVKALNSALSETEGELTVLENKITTAGIEPILLNKKNIEELDETIKSYSAEEVIEAASRKSGDLYGTLRKRNELSRMNFDYKEELASLTLVLSSVPLDISEKVKTYVETGGTECTKIDVEGISAEKIAEVVRLLNRLGAGAKQDGKQIVREELNGSAEVPRIVNGHKIWVRSDRVKDFDRIHNELDGVSKNIMAITAKKQVEALSVDEDKTFKDLQRKYVELVSKREQLLSKNN